MTLRDLFESALALAPAARAAFLDAQCPDPAVRARVESLLRADESEDDPVSSASLDHLVRAIGDASAPALPPGSRIGPFEIVRVIGEGGSSTVFEAHRELEGARQSVALKLLRQNLLSPEARRRFGREQRALIRLQHPNIARMVEAGLTPEGLAYIALELIDGVPITDFARTSALGARERLQMFATVCRAVDAAHRALIVHRDIKPSNVLVTAEGEVKLLDFGIAKLLADETGEEATVLQAFTPAYAAPEQVGGGAITTATDVYALGVVLGELLTGERDSSRTASGRNGVQPAPAQAPVTRRRLRGDLDAVMAKATESEPERRYASAGALAEDIECLLDDRPVRAQPQTRWYRTRKFVARHKGGVAATLAFLLATFAALGVAVWQAQMAREQTRIARNESARSNATRTFLVDLLKTASADLPKDERPTPEALVASAAQQARDDADLDPLVRAQLLLTFSEIAHSNGDDANAEHFVDEAIERERALGIAQTSPEWIQALVLKGNLLHSTNRSREADRLMGDLLPRIETVDSEEAISALMLYGATRGYANDAETAVETAKRALAKAKRVFGADSVNGIETATYLGQLCAHVHRYRDSAAILDEAIARWRRLGLPLDEQFGRSLFHLANARYRLGQREAAEAAYREGITLMRRVHEAPFHRVAEGLIGYAQLLIDDERFDEARAALDEALSIYRTVLGADNARTASALDLQAQWFAARRQFAASEEAARSAHDALLPVADEAGYKLELALSGVHRASALLALGRADEAAAVHGQAMPILEQQFGGESRELAEGLCVSGRVRLANADAAGALAVADRALALLQRLDVTATSEDVECRGLRAEALLALSRRTDARAEIDSALRHLRSANPGARVKLTRLLVLRALSERAGGDDRAASATLEEARVLAVDAGLLTAGERGALGSPAQP
jgi:tetratricopeptide (TPR) repeat protein/tRNA A-37 threonylcarbamoyl transferase component Bud32